MTHDFNEIETKEDYHGHGTYKTYTVGFLTCIALTLIMYFLVVGNFFSGWTLDFVIIGLSLVQVIVQLLFFLHLGDESKPYWNLITFLFMFMVIIIVVSGSIWIIFDLDYRTMREMMEVMSEGK